MNTDIIIMGAAIVLILLAVYSDIRWRIISNKLTLPAIAVGLILNLACNGWHGLLSGLGGVAAGIGLMLIPFTFGQMGGGDVKFMGALGAILGGVPIINIFFYSTIAGGVLALIAIMIRGDFKAVIMRIWFLIQCMFLLRSPSTGAHLFQKSTTIPYGVAIGAGAFCFMLLGNII